MKIYRLNNLDELKNIHATSFAQNIAHQKGNIFYFKIEALISPAANILKQEALSVGGDFIMEKEAILCKKDFYAGILILTQSQLMRLIEKCLIQPFGLKDLSQILKTHIKNQNIKPKIMGVINITDDSFYEDSRLTKIDDILRKIDEWINLGIDIIDIGGASSRPNSKIVDSKTELKRIKKAIEAIFNAGFIQKCNFSIDSYNFETIEFCLKKDFKIINDVNSLQDERLINLALDFKSDIILMHNSWIQPKIHENIIINLDDFFTNKLEVLNKFNIKNIILDIGFGFGKNENENLDLIRNLRHFTHFGYEILVGASRKRTIGEILNKDTKDRLYGTLALHQIALQNGANIIRCHDVEAHIDMIKIFNELI